MAQTRLLQPLNITNSITIDAHDIVRGVNSELDIAAISEVGTRTGWSLTDPPDNVTISDTGVLEFEVNHVQDFDVTQISVITDQGGIDVPVTIRDMFPNDFLVPVGHFWSAWRSFDGTARELFVATYRYLENGVQTTQEVTVSSADDGYLDLDALATTLNAIAPSGMLYVTTIRDQRTGFDLIASEGAEFFAARIDNGAIHQSTQRLNGNLMLRSAWRLNAFDSTWDSTLRHATFNAADASGISIPSPHAIVTVQRKIGSSIDEDHKEFHAGDHNSYNPGIRDTTVNQEVYRFNVSGGRPPDLALNAGENPFVLVASERPVPDSAFNVRDFSAFRLDIDSTASGTINTTNENEGRGAELEMGDFDWAEMAFYAIVDTDFGSTSWNNNFVELINNYVGALAGGDHIY